MHALFNTSRILVCDDSPTFTAMLGAILREEGCAEVIGVNDPREVMPLLTGRAFDLLLLDMMMPHLDGVAVTRLVRQQFAGAELPILVLTGSQDTALCNQALAEGANDYLHKPIDPVEVALRARNLLLIRKSHKDQLAYSERLEAEVAARTARLDMLIDNGVQLSSERQHSRLLQAILAGGCRIGHCEAATLFLVTEDKHLRFAMRTLDDPLPVSDIPLYDAATGKPILHFVSTWVAHNNASVHIPDVYRGTRFDLSGTRAFDAQTRHRTVSMLAVPLCPRDGEVLGVLQFMNARDPDTDAIVPFSPQIAKFLEALAMQAATALDIHNLLQSRDRLIDGIIRVLASTIDARSPPTGHHCQRMPELAGMLAEAASACQEGKLAGFRFLEEDEWHEFRVAAWLHDCGKLTTPDHIVDKSTKLDLFHNRLHEIRMRFEVLLRDAMIERLECIAAGQPVTAADTRFAARKAELIDDFRFVAECNLGQEAMSTEHRERLERIGGTVWMRHFDDRIGLSMEESRRRGHPEDGPPLPAPERLLADQPWHVIPRPESERARLDREFNIPVPVNEYHHGELYNLSIARGTLTEEERYKINEHIVQTIHMLEQLPFPAHLARVPEYAGNHHETLDGSGYPRGLDASQLSIPARILAIADIFEALTAADRPYKHGKTLSESLAILSGLARQGRLDAELYNLMLDSGVVMRYATTYLNPEQIDLTDPGAFRIA